MILNSNNISKLYHILLDLKQINYLYILYNIISILFEYITMLLFFMLLYFLDGFLLVTSDSLCLRNTVLYPHICGKYKMCIGPIFVITWTIVKESHESHNTEYLPWCSPPYFLLGSFVSDVKEDKEEKWLPAFALLPS